MGSAASREGCSFSAADMSAKKGLCGRACCNLWRGTYSQASCQAKTCGCGILAEQPVVGYRSCQLAWAACRTGRIRIWQCMAEPVAFCAAVSACASAPWELIGIDGGKVVWRTAPLLLMAGCEAASLLCNCMLQVLQLIGDLLPSFQQGSTACACPYLWRLGCEVCS